MEGVAIRAAEQGIGGARLLDDRGGGRVGGDMRELCGYEAKGKVLYLESTGGFVARGPGLK